MAIETDEDLSLFFDTDDFAEGCVVTGPGAFTKNINVIFDKVTESETLYDTNVEASSPHFMCSESDAADLKRGMSATLRNEVYKIERVAVLEPDIATVYLSK